MRVGESLIEDLPGDQVLLSLDDLMSIRAPHTYLVEVDRNRIYGGRDILTRYLGRGQKC